MTPVGGGLNGNLHWTAAVRIRARRRRRVAGDAKSSVRNCWPTVCWINSLICVLWLAASKRVSSVIIQSETIGAVSGNASQLAIFPVRSA